MTLIPISISRFSWQRFAFLRRDKRLVVALAVGGIACGALTWAVFQGFGQSWPRGHDVTPKASRTVPQLTLGVRG